MTPQMIERVAQVLNDFLDGGEPTLSDSIDELGDCMTLAGLLDSSGGRRYYVRPQAPEAPAISPATINLIVAAINCNARTSLYKDCVALANVRNAMDKEGLIERVNGVKCRSLVDEPVEAPVVSFVLKGL
jgi:hypothetical protein